MNILLTLLAFIISLLMVLIYLTPFTAVILLLLKYKVRGSIVMTTAVILSILAMWLGLYLNNLLGAWYG